IAVPHRGQGAPGRRGAGDDGAGPRPRHHPQHAHPRTRRLGGGDRRRRGGRSGMTVLQIAALAAVAVGGGAVVIAPDPLRQVLVLGIFGMSLAVLFFVFQSPDVALSELVVSSVGLPVMVLLT